MSFITEMKINMLPDFSKSTQSTLQTKILVFVKYMTNSTVLTTFFIKKIPQFYIRNIMNNQRNKTFVEILRFESFGKID